ncbi:MAG: response regulator [Blastocatellia bacterium]
MTKHYKILLIDDTREDRVTYSRYLTQDAEAAYEFLEAEQSQTGLALAQSAAPDCILLDYALPDGDGLTLLSQLSALPGAAALPVVMLTGTDDATVAVAAMKRGAQDYLVKGRFTAADLRRAVSNAMEKAALINEQRRSLAALREGEARLKLAMNAAAIYSWEVDATNGRVSWSENAAQVLGFHSTALPSSLPDAQALSHPADVARVRQEVEKALTIPPFAFSFEQRLVNPADQSVVWVQVQGTGSQLVNGRPTRLVGLAQNITKRKEAEEQLRASERRFRGIFNHQFQFSGLLTPEGKIVQISESALRNAGRRPEELAGESFLALPWWNDLPETQQKWQAQFAEALVQPVSSRVEAPFRLPDGSLRYALNTATALRDEYGAVEYLLVEGVDITERRQAEEALRKAQTELQLSLDASRAGTWSWDVAHNISTWDDRYHALYGFAPDAPRSFATWMSGVHADDRAQLQTRISSMLATPDDNTWNQEFRALHPTRGLRWMHGLGRIERDAQGQAVRFSGINLDITERKQAESEREQLLAREQAARQLAEETSRLKDNFLTTISHELRTPLSHVLGWVVMLRTGKVAADNVPDVLATIERNARLQQRLIDDLLDTSQVVTGKMQLRWQPFRLAEVIEAAVNSARPAATARNIQLEVAIDPLPAPFQGDPDRVQQIVWNLVANAIKFTPPSGRVSVRLKQREQHAEISVSDTGEGIAPEFLPFVFNRFIQADTSISRKHGGLGLGLALVRHLVELHGGAVSAQSPGLGQGAVFTVALPLSGNEEEAEKEAAQSHESAAPALSLTPSLSPSLPLSGVRVLAVDDEADARQLLTAILSASGAEVHTAGSLVEALQLLDTWQPDVLVSDIGMPNGDGYDLVRAIRQRHSTTGQWLPAIALTAYARVEDRMRALAAGFQMYVTKPVEPQELLVVVASLTRTR